MNRLEDLEKEILDILADGMVVGRSVEEFIYSSTGMNPDPTFLEEAIFCESSELESVLDLVFFPDDCVRDRVEKVIPDSFKEADEKNLIDKIISIRPVCSLRFSESDFSVAVPVPERLVGRFVRRLNLSLYMPEQLRELISTHYPGREHSVFKNIRAREGRTHSLNLITDFLKKITGIFSPEIEDLNIIMTISGMFPEETEIVSAINHAYRKWESSLKKHEDMEKALSSGCMEELMARGIRIQTINREDIEKKMAAAARITNLLIPCFSQGANPF